MFPMVAFERIGVDGEVWFVGTAAAVIGLTDEGGGGRARINRLLWTTSVSKLRNQISHALLETVNNC